MCANPPCWTSPGSGCMSIFRATPCDGTFSGRIKEITWSLPSTVKATSRQATAASVAKPRRQNGRWMASGRLVDLFAPHDDLLAVRITAREHEFQVLRLGSGKAWREHQQRRERLCPTN